MADKGTTPDKFDFPEDTRSKKEAQDPKNTYQHVTRSGHVFEMCDNAEGEHITLQHRGGSLIQFQPDGKIIITAHNGMYTAVFGEDRMYIKGAYDIVVDGAASLKVKKDYNVTVDGNYNLTVTGDMNTIVGKNQNTNILADQVVHAENQTTKIAKNTEHTTEGKAYFGSHGGLGLVCTGGDTEVASDKRVNVSSGQKTYVQSYGEILVKSASGMVIQDPSGIDIN